MYPSDNFWRDILVMSTGLPEFCGGQYSELQISFVACKQWILEAIDAIDSMGGSHRAKVNEDKVRMWLKTLFPRCLC